MAQREQFKYRCYAEKLAQQVQATQKLSVSLGDFGWVDVHFDARFQTASEVRDCVAAYAIELARQLQSAPPLCVVRSDLHVEYEFPEKKGGEHNARPVSERASR